MGRQDETSFSIALAQFFLEPLYLSHRVCYNIFINNELLMFQQDFDHVDSFQIADSKQQ